MLDVLHKMDNDLPQLLKESWISSGVDSVYRVIGNYVLELHRTSSLQAWDWATQFAVKIVSGHCEFHINHAEHWSKIISETGFEYEIVSGGHCVRLHPFDETLAIVVLPKKERVHLNLGHDSAAIINAFIPFYEEETIQRDNKPTQDFKWRIGHEDGCVMTDFQQKISWMALKPEEAELRRQEAYCITLERQEGFNHDDTGALSGLFGRRSYWRCAGCSC